MSAVAKRLRAKRERTRERARPRAAKPAGPVRARAVDPAASKGPAWARSDWQPKDPARAQFLDDDDGYREWLMRRETGIASDAPHFAVNWMGHGVYRMPVGFNMFGWKLH